MRQCLFFSITFFRWLSGEKTVDWSLGIFRYHIGRSVRHHSGDPIPFTVVLHLPLCDAPFFSSFFCSHIAVHGINLLLHRKRTISYNILPCVRRNVNARRRNPEFVLAKLQAQYLTQILPEGTHQARRRFPSAAPGLSVL